MIILEDHYNDKDTIITKINGNVIISNGCKIFDKKHLDIVCKKFNVNDEQKQQVIDSSNKVEECNDLIKLLQKDCRFSNFLNTTQLQQIVEKTDDEDALQAVAQSDKVTTELLQQIVEKNNDWRALRAVAQSDKVTTELLQQIVEKTDDWYALQAVAQSDKVTTELLQQIVEKTDDWYALQAVALKLLEIINKKQDGFMSDFEPDCKEQQSEWIGYDENRFKSLRPVDVLLDDDSLIEDVILFDGGIYDLDFEALEIRGICTIKLRRIPSLKDKIVKCYR